MFYWRDWPRYTSWFARLAIETLSYRESHRFVANHSTRAVCQASRSQACLACRPKWVKYSAPNDNGRIGYVVASDVRSGATLWDIKVFEVQIDPKLEEDVQWVFIADLKLDGNTLRVKDEKSRCYNLNLSTKTVEKRILCW